MRTLALAICLALSTPTFAATAFLVSQRMGLSVTGQSITVCTYAYGSQQFERAFPMGQMCPMSVVVY
jgi:hypothetical protein